MNELRICPMSPCTSRMFRYALSAASSVVFDFVCLEIAGEMTIDLCGLMRLLLGEYTLENSVLLQPPKVVWLSNFMGVHIIAFFTMRKEEFEYLYKKATSRCERWVFLSKCIWL